MPTLQFSRAAMKQAQVSRGVSRKELAARLGRSVSLVNHWLYGVKSPDLISIGRLADALGVEYTELIERVEVTK
ncbi:Helix-turn-helix [Actinacidiphila rubida]|uniref:Helix-turn-helix n=1 Tax=Actinacidiphila rubida TaxID=310780 RepID=A0A1H8L8J8_9ACTN|nr:helix-turn-helix transcriptional regulator [Actinacidiphila rubida]SEO01399.1 Helix-turn-helix [Actinacidiphila rubida]